MPPLAPEWPSGLVPISRRRLVVAVATRLAGSGVAAFRGGVPPDGPPLLAGDATGRVAPYVVLAATPGSPTPDGEDLGDTHLDLDWLIALTVVAGDGDACLAACDRIHGALFRWAPAWAEVTEVRAGDFPAGTAAVGVPLLGLSGLRPPVGWQPSTVLREDDVSPARFSAGLQYRTTVTT